MSKAQVLLSLLKAVDEATDRQLKVVATNKGVNLSFKIRKKGVAALKVTWTAAGSPRINGRPVLLGDGRVLKATDFKTPTQRRKMEQVIRAASKGSLLEQSEDGYVINTGRLLPQKQL